MILPSPPPIVFRPESPATVIKALNFMGAGLAAVTGVLALMITLLYILHCYLGRYCRTRALDIESGLQADRAVAYALAGFRLDLLAAEVRDPAARVAFVGTTMAYKEMKTEKKGDDICAICLEEFGEEEICGVVESCKHYFHKDCMERWLAVEPRCPLCRCLVKN